MLEALGKTLSGDSRGAGASPSDVGEGIWVGNVCQLRQTANCAIRNLFVGSDARAAEAGVWRLRESKTISHSSA